jgi:hypothetical protein
MKITAFFKEFPEMTDRTMSIKTIKTLIAFSSLAIGGLSYGMMTAQPTLAAPTVAAPTTIAQANAEPPHDPRSDRSPWQLIKTKTSKGMSYGELRKFALSNGWEPIVDPDCKTNVGGPATICETQPETSACSGQGHCIFQLQHRFKDVAVKIITYNGRIRSAEFTRKRSEAQVSETSARCPSQNFTRFLAAYSSDKTIRDQFTLPEIQVEQLVDDEQGFRTKTVTIPKAQYRDYTLAYRNGLFYNMLGGGSGIRLTVSPETKPKSGRLNIIKQGEDYFVKSLIGVSEGNSWLFKRTNGCWSLAADPEAPSP